MVRTMRKSVYEENSLCPNCNGRVVDVAAQEQYVDYRCMDCYTGYSTREMGKYDPDYVNIAHPKMFAGIMLAMLGMGKEKILRWWKGR